MTNDQSIIIEKANNGFIVRPAPTYSHPPNEYISTNDIYVFETMEHLQEWLIAHFSE